MFSSRNEYSNQAIMLSEPSIITEKQNYYERLGVRKNATLREIKTAYKKLVLKYHPDHNASIEAQTIIVLINEAYETLSDPGKREAYDKQRDFDSGNQIRELEHWPLLLVDTNTYLWRIGILMILMDVIRVASSGGSEFDPISFSLYSSTNFTGAMHTNAQFWAPIPRRIIPIPSTGSNHQRFEGVGGQLDETPEDLGKNKIKPTGLINIVATLDVDESEKLDFTGVTLVFDTEADALKLRNELREAQSRKTVSLKLLYSHWKKFGNIENRKTFFTLKPVMNSSLDNKIEMDPEQDGALVLNEFKKFVNVTNIKMQIYNTASQEFVDNLSSFSLRLQKILSEALQIGQSIVGGEDDGALNIQVGNEDIRDKILALMLPKQHPETFLYHEPVESIPSEQLLILDGYAFDAEELKERADDELDDFYINPYKKTTDGDIEFSPKAKEALDSHPILGKYATELKNHLFEQKKGIHPETLDAVVTMLLKFASDGLKGVDQARAQFIEHFSSLSDEQQSTLNRYIIRVKSQYGGTQNLTFSDAFNSGCIRSAQVFPWCFAIDLEPDYYHKVPDSVFKIARSMHLVIENPNPDAQITNTEIENYPNIYSRGILGRNRDDSFENNESLARQDRTNNNRAHLLFATEVRRLIILLSRSLEDNSHADATVQMLDALLALTSSTDSEEVFGPALEEMELDGEILLFRNNP